MSTRRKGEKRGSGHRKAAYLQLRLDEAEKQAFEDAAELSGLALSAWVRERLRKCATRELEEAARPIAFLDHYQAK